MAEISSIDVFNALKDKVGEKEAKMLTEFVEHKADESYEKAERQLATKQDLTKLESSLKESISKLEVSMNNIASRLETKIADSKTETLRWAFAFLIPFYISLIGFLLKYFS